MRFVLDIAKTRDGRFEGRLATPGTARQQDFSGILELLAILEQQLRPDGHDGAWPAGDDSGTDPDGTDESDST